ncbi:MAG: bifunctional hydroxymethylpyrimidine kinase/phosphomethylpyrimidine kinase [Deltaproteobacteria bacterium]|nr:bifunctional hydroxymethylpyrimidine kinase/phosphomethylpyrimidine kinase [Deltaproteobacteria bacterium]
MSVLIVGSMAVDTVEFSGSGERRELVGGSATFAALSCGLFSPVRLVGVVGEDFPKSTLEALRRRRTDLEGVQVVPGETFRWHGRYSEDLSSRVSLETHLNVFEHFRPKLPTSWRDSKMVLLGNIHPSLQAEVLDQVDKPLVVAADTMNFWIQGTPKELRALLTRVDLLILNEEEARELTGHRMVARVGRELRALGPRRVVIKQGEYGAYLFDEHGVFHSPAYPVDQVLDPTGAGDTFAGAMLGYLSAHGAQAPDRRTLRRAVVVGSAMASLCVERYGTEGLLEVTPDALDARVRAFGRLVHTDAEGD